MSLSGAVANAIAKVDELHNLVKGQYSKWNNQVSSKINELENWKNSLKTLRVGNGSNGTQIINAFQYFEGGKTSVGETHIETDIKDGEYRTFCYKIIGYMLNQPLAINAVLTGYMYGENSLKNFNSSQLGIECYVNSDGYVTFKISGDPYYGSLSIDNIRVGNGGFCGIRKVVVSENNL